MVVKYEQVHLQGIGKMPAKSVKDLRMGDRIIWNYGAISTVMNLVASKSGKTFDLTTKNNQVAIVIE